MTKVNEQILFDDSENKLIVKETHDFTSVAESAKALKSAGVLGMGNENRLVARIPVKMMAIWAKKWGVDMSDTKAMQEVLKRELLNSDNAQFRVWEGTY